MSLQRNLVSGRCRIFDLELVTTSLWEMSRLAATPFRDEPASTSTSLRNSLTSLISSALPGRGWRRTKLTIKTKLRKTESKALMATALHKKHLVSVRWRAGVCYFLSLLLVLCAVVRVFSQASKDLPGPTANPTSIPTGSLVIAMDNTNQAIGAAFNLKAYGLVNNLLQNGIPVMWAIKAGKAKDATDFT